MSGQTRKLIKLSLQNLMIFIVGILLGSLVAAWESEAATLTPDAAVSGVQFANEVNIETRLDFGFRVTGDEGRNDVRLLGFFESGNKGQKSIDLDPVVLRLGSFESGHVWVGRTHPAGESFGLMTIERTSAVGANWTQNQHNALEPRVSGWIGTGFRTPIPSTPMFASAGISPIFLPSFGPSLELSDSQDASGSRFAKLPPGEVRINKDAVLPIRYDLQTGDVRDIVQQWQWFHSIGFDNKEYHASVFGWSGPKPDPVIDHSESLRIVREKDVDVLVTARPSFPRQHFWGGRLAARKLPLSPELELAWEARSDLTTASATVQPFSHLRMGVLNRFGDPDATYARTLLWTAAQSRIYKSLSGELRYEQHLAKEKEGGFVKPTLLLQTTPAFGMFATANVIAGEDGSYFGAWRALDSVSVGARAQW